MDIQLYLDILGIDSTSGSEAALAGFLAERLKTERNELELIPTGDGTVNLFFKWGDPQLVFCTHMDTVPPFIAPSVEEKGGDTIFKGRGTCDAKGQIFTMWTACKTLEQQGKSGFGLLLLAGEETGSYGAKAVTKAGVGARYLVVGEPTDNCMVEASKGTKSFVMHISGEAFHSGYPENGASAVERFVDFVNDLRAADLPVDDRMGKTTWNIGKLVSDNPQNILSPSLDFRLYFRTTFASDAIVSELIPAMAEQRDWLSFEAVGGDAPLEYFTIDGMSTKTVNFGSDAPHLKGFEHRAICGAGTILVAHRDNEYVRLSELETAVSNYLHMYEKVNK